MPKEDNIGHKTPLKFKVGDLVKLQPSSKYYYQHSHGYPGVVAIVAPPEFDFSYRVQWADGYLLLYNDEDLLPYGTVAAATAPPAHTPQWTPAIGDKVWLRVTSWFHYQQQSNAGIVTNGEDDFCGKPWCVVAWGKTTNSYPVEDLICANDWDTATFAVGDKVWIHPLSPYAESQQQPTPGEVTHVDAWTKVKWANHSNAYPINGTKSSHGCPQPYHHLIHATSPVAPALPKGVAAKKVSFPSIDAAPPTPTPTYTEPYSTWPQPELSPEQRLLVSVCRIVQRYYKALHRQAEERLQLKPPVLREYDVQQLAQLFWTSAVCELRHRRQQCKYVPSNTADFIEWLDDIPAYNGTGNRASCTKATIAYLDSNYHDLGTYAQWLEDASRVFCGQWTTSYGGKRWAHATWQAAVFIRSWLDAPDDVPIAVWEAWLSATHNGGLWLDKVCNGMYGINPLVVILTWGRDTHQHIEDIHQLDVYTSYDVLRRLGSTIVATPSSEDRTHWMTPGTAEDYLPTPGAPQRCGECGHYMDDCTCGYCSDCEDDPCHCHLHCSECGCHEDDCTCYDECPECGHHPDDCSCCSKCGNAPEGCICVHEEKCAECQQEGHYIDCCVDNGDCPHYCSDCDNMEWQCTCSTTTKEEPTNAEEEDPQASNDTHSDSDDDVVSTAEELHPQPVATVRTSQAMAA